MDSLKDKCIEVHICSNLDCQYHGHNWLELTYVMHGVANHNLNGENTKIKKGDFFILDYKAMHNYVAETDKFVVINCIFTPDFIDRSLRDCRKFSEVVNSYMIRHSHTIINISPANYVLSDEDGSVKKLLEEILAEFENERTGYIEIIRCKLIEIIINTMRKRSTNEFDGTDKLSSAMISFAEKNITEKDILSAFSKKLSFSPSYLSRKFKEDTGITFSNYVQKLRLETACRLLTNTNKKVTEIAFLSGYSDVKFFNKLFKRHLGMTPRSFRNYNSQRELS